jgi:hypothetical protein
MREEKWALSACQDGLADMFGYVCAGFSLLAAGH